MATFKETCALTSRKYVTKPGMIIPNLSEKFQFFWSHSFVFPLEKQPRNLSCQSFLSSKRSFGGYFQWNACAYSQNVCSWTSYSNAKLIKSISNFLVPLLRFCFRIIASKILIFEFLLLPNKLLVTTLTETRPLTSRNYEIKKST